MDEIKKITNELIQKIDYGIDGFSEEHDAELDIAVITLQTENTKQIIGRNGETLRSINYIIRKLFEQKFPEQTSPNFIIDVDGYHKKIIENLKMKARIVAERAQSFKNSIELEPMTAYHRLLIHSYLTRFPNIETESAGEGKDRHIVVKYIENQTPVI